MAALALAAAAVVAVVVVLALTVFGGSAHKSQPAPSATKSAATQLVIKVISDHGLATRKYVVFVSFSAGRQPVLARSLPASGKLVLSAVPARMIAHKRVAARVASFTASPCLGSCGVFHGGISLGSVIVSDQKRPLTITVTPHCRVLSKGTPPIFCSNPSVRTS